MRLLCTNDDGILAQGLACLIEAAEALGLHRHTVVYRIGRLRELGIDVDHPQQRHELWLALRCSRLLASSAAPPDLARPTRP